MAALPQELKVEILSWLPVKSLLRFKTASKKWYSLISQDHKFHLKQSSSSSASKNLILYQMSRIREGSVFQYSDIDTSESRKIIFPAEITKSCRLIGSANGLICLGPAFEDRGSCFIWNPCTGDCKNISLPFGYAYDSISGENSSYTRLFGFAYDSISDDYKIIGDCHSRIRVFSLKTYSWKMLDFSVKCPEFVYGFYLNGALHWCDTATPHITAFDLSKENIFFIELPEEIKLWYWGGNCLPLFDYQGSLCTCDGKSIWVMREYGNAKSWAKFTTSLPKECLAPIGISRLGEVVYRTRGSGLGFVKSDIQGRISDEDKSQISCNGSFIYNESLISPKCFDPK